MKKFLFGCLILFLIFCTIILYIFIVGALKTPEKKEKFKENELITWRLSDEFVFKGYLGERRMHIPDQFDAQFYFPNHEKFIGQFPIDYVPKKFERLPPEEMQQILNDHFNYPLEFNLMLNGSWTMPTDESIVTPKGLDHEDQVKIKMSITYNKDDTTQKLFEDILSDNLNPHSKHDLYGMKCFNFNNGHDGKRCLGKSTNPKISAYTILILPNEEQTVTVYYYEKLYGGINITYLLHEKNLNQINKIDQAIWRLLDTWNIERK